MRQPISTARFESLKRQAKRLERATPDLSHSMALDRIAVSEGYANWSLLARNVVGGAPSSVAPVLARRSLTLTAAVGTSIHRARVLGTKVVPCKYPISRYSRFEWFPTDGIALSRDERDACHMMATAMRAVAFMDATDLRPSRAHESVFGTHGVPPGFDHPCVWRDELRNYLVSVEPYIRETDDFESIADWCTRSGWRWLPLPKGRGIWFPCDETCEPDCEGHTQMVLMVPPMRGAALDTVASACRDLPIISNTLRGLQPLNRAISTSGGATTRL